MDGLDLLISRFEKSESVRQLSAEEARADALEKAFIMLWSNPAFQSQFNIFAWDKVHAARNLEARELADKNTWGDELETETPSEKPCAGLEEGDVFKDDNIVQNNLYY